MVRVGGWGSSSSSQHYVGTQTDSEPLASSTLALWGWSSWSLASTCSWRREYGGTSSCCIGWCGNGIRHFSPYSCGQISFQVHPSIRQPEKCRLMLCPAKNGSYFVINWPISSSAHVFGIQFIFSPDKNHSFFPEALPSISHVVSDSLLRANIWRMWSSFSDLEVFLHGPVCYNL